VLNKLEFLNICSFCLKTEVTQLLIKIMFINLLITKKTSNYRGNYVFLSKSKQRKEILNFEYNKKLLIYNIAYKFKNQIIENCIVFIEHLLIRNKYTNLVSKQGAQYIYNKHFIDSLTISSILNSLWPNSPKISGLDIGTGGGFPGFILSIFFPQIFFCLLDSIKKKIDFHVKISTFLRLDNCKPLSTRAEWLGKTLNHRKCYNFIFTRAVSDISELIKICLPLLERTGKLFMMKKIKNNSQELKNSLYIILNNKSKLKSIVVTSILEEGKIILVINKCEDFIEKNLYN
jgi:16S rRNA (guanine527-N7)-methyltransferase